MAKAQTIIFTDPKPIQFRPWTTRDAHLRWLEAMLFHSADAPPNQDFTPQQRRVLGMFATRRAWSYGGIWEGLYGDLSECDQPTDKAHKVIIHHIKHHKTIKRAGIVIRTSYAQGYYVDETDQKKIRELLNGKKEQ